MKRKTAKTEYIMKAHLRPLPLSESILFRSEDDLFVIQKENSIIGHFRILPYSDGLTAYFYDFELEESLRGSGLGNEVFRAIRAFLYNEGFRIIKLQVSRRNPAAFHLYKNSGLKITESA